MELLESRAVRSLVRDIADLRQKPIDGITLRDTEDVRVVEAEIMGPGVHPPPLVTIVFTIEDTPFYGGVFLVKLEFHPPYPEIPPKGFFVTRVFHPNVSSPRGEICVNTLKRDWNPMLGLRHVLMVIRCLLIEPNAESALNDEAGRLLLEDYDAYCKRARLMTQLHARKEGTAGGGAGAGGGGAGGGGGSGVRGGVGGSKENTKENTNEPPKVDGASKAVAAAPGAERSPLRTDNLAARKPKAKPKKALSRL